MEDGVPMSGKTGIDLRQSLLTWVLAILAVAALGTAMTGWVSLWHKQQAAGVGQPAEAGRSPEEVRSIGDAIYRSFASLHHSGSLEDSSKWEVNPWIEISRWLGLVLVFLVGFKAFVVFAARRVRRLRARWRSNHLLMIGSQSIAAGAAGFANSLRVPVNWLVAAADSKEHARAYHQDNAWDLADATHFGLQRARCVFVAMADDAATIAIARQLRSELGEAAATKLVVSIQSPWLAGQIDQLLENGGARVTSPARAAARQIHRRHPLFLLARKFDQPRIHAVILGWSHYAESILVEAVISCRTIYQGVPRFTIVDGQAEQIISTLTLRYPELHKSAELSCIRGSVSDRSAILSESELLQCHADAPVTAIYSCADTEAEALSAALAMRTVAMRTGLIQAPIFARTNLAQTLPAAEAGAQKLQPLQLVGFGDLKSLAKDAGILGEGADELAMKLHEAYRSAGSAERVAAVSWERLPEDMRESNRRIVAHLPAMLSSAGEGIEGWLQQMEEQQSWSGWPGNAGSGVVTAELAESLAQLEHERWMADRRVNGWRFGSPRNDNRREHPDLVPFDQLSDQSRKYDRQVVQTLMASMGRTVVTPTTAK
jgi:hypothetical protein